MIKAEHLKLLLQNPYYPYIDKPREAILLYYKKKLAPSFLTYEDENILIEFILSKIKDCLIKSTGLLDLTELFDATNDAYLLPYTDNDGTIYHNELSEDEYDYVLVAALVFCTKLGYEIEVFEESYLINFKEHTHLMARFTRYQ